MITTSCGLLVGAKRETNLGTFAKLQDHDPIGCLPEEMHSRAVCKESHGAEIRTDSKDKCTCK